MSKIKLAHPVKQMHVHIPQPWQNCFPGRIDKLYPFSLNLRARFPLFQGLDAAAFNHDYDVSARISTAAVDKSSASDYERALWVGHDLRLHSGRFILWPMCAFLSDSRTAVNFFGCWTESYLRCVDY